MPLLLQKHPLLSAAEKTGPNKIIVTPETFTVDFASSFYTDTFNADALLTLTQDFLTLYHQGVYRDRPLPENLLGRKRILRAFQTHFTYIQKRYKDIGMKKKTKEELDHILRRNAKRSRRQTVTV
jgi:hypothetical protein